MSRSPLARSGATIASVLTLLAACDNPSVPLDVPKDVSASHHVHATEATQLVALRQVTARYENFNQAFAAGYQAKITSCWAHATRGAMGYHYADPTLLDATIDLLRPEVLMYEPNPAGVLNLVGMEYIVPKDAWTQAGHDPADPADVPTLLGQAFTPHSSLPIFKLHIWLWRNNPQGTFADWNPKVTCASAPDVDIFN